MTAQRLLAGKGNFVPVTSYDATVREAITQLDIDNAGALVVTDDKRRILGPLSERDIVRGMKTYGPDIWDKHLSGLMTHKVVTSDIDEPLSSILQLMDEHQIRHVPITRDGLLCGIINILDVIKYRLGEIDAQARALKAYVSGRA
jgi:CBS domain-containing protein